MLASATWWPQGHVWCGFVIQGGARHWRRAAGARSLGVGVAVAGDSGPAVAPSPVWGGGGPTSTVMCVSDTAWELSHTLCWPRGQVAQGPQSPAFLLDTWTEFPD